MAGDLAGQAPHLAKQQLDLVETALVEGPRVEVEVLGLAQDRGVVLLPERPLAGRRGPHLLEEGGVRLKRVSCLGAGGSEVGPMLLGDVGRQKVAHVARTGTCLVDRPLQDDERHQRWPQVRAAGREVGGDGAQPGRRRRRELALGTQPVEKQDEDAAHPRVEVEVGLAAPDLPGVVDGTLAELGHGEVAVDRLVKRQLVVAEGGESVEPGGGARSIGLDRLGRQVVELVVVLGQTEVRGTHGVGGVLLVEELGGKVSEGRHWVGTPNWLWDTRTGEDAGSIARWSGSVTVRTTRCGAVRPSSARWRHEPAEAVGIGGGRDLDRVERGALAEVVARQPEREAAVAAGDGAQPPDEHRVTALGVSGIG